MTLFGVPFTLAGAAIGISTVRRLAHGPIDTQQLVLGITMFLMFGGAGIGLIVLGITRGHSAAKAETLKSANPDKPWLWSEDWVQGYATPEWKATSTLMTLIGVAFLLFSIPMLIILPRSAGLGWGQAAN